MTDYVQPCIRENEPDHAILHVGIKKLNSVLPAKRITKSLIDVTKTCKYTLFSFSYIATCDIDIIDTLRRAILILILINNILNIFLFIL